MTFNLDPYDLDADLVSVKVNNLTVISASKVISLYSYCIRAHTHGVSTALHDHKMMAGIMTNASACTDGNSETTVGL